MAATSKGEGDSILEAPLSNLSELGEQRDSLAAGSDDGALSSNASTIPITDRSNSSPSTETPLLSLMGPVRDSLHSSSSHSSMSHNRRGPDAPPALPPRPPNLPLPIGMTEEHSMPLPPHAFANNQDSRLYSERLHSHIATHIPPRSGSNQSQEDLKKSWWKRVTKKYVLLCILCGGVCILLGLLFGVIFFLLRHYTSSLHYFQTLPTYIPSVMLILTGIMVLCFGRRCNRNGYLIKICGAFCLLSALVCVVVTVTTTVIHMNRLQTLRECVYQGSSKTCTCFAGILLDPTIHHDATLRYVFANAPNCEVIHGILYSCLRAMFGLSVIGILVCIFSSMLVYQLLSHEKKKKYWEQLEVRCQHLYRLSPPGLGPSGSPHCGCCFESSANSGSGLRSSCHWPNAALDLLDERYWPLSRAGPSLTNATSSNHQQVVLPSVVDHVSSGNNSNIYSPNPSAPDTLLTSLGSSDASQTEAVSRSISLRSMRTWFRRLSRAESTGRGLHRGTLSHPTSLHPHNHHHAHHHHHPRMHLHQLWRISSDSQYGFRVPPSSTSVSLPQYAPPQHALWGPPPPYSNSNNNINSNTPAAGRCEELPAQNPPARTTKSGLLKSYDETVKSAMHIYSKTASLPSRRPKKPRAALLNPPELSAKSLADITSSGGEDEAEALSVSEVRRKLQSLGLYKVHQRSKTARELAEIRQALHDLQKSDIIYAPPSSHGGSSSSTTTTTENKYETIGQSIRPYKIQQQQLQQETMEDSVSSHYAQISPLHGTGLPLAKNPSTPNTPVKSYFKEIHRNSDPKSLPIEVLRGDELHGNQILGAPISSQLLHSLNSVGARKGFHKSSSSSMEILSSSSMGDHSSSSLLCPLPTRRGERESQVTNNKLSNSDTKLWNKSAATVSSKQNASTPSSSATSSVKKAPALVQQCVYLRPEQNIPDIFGNAAFKPIPDGSDDKNSGNSGRSPDEEEFREDGVISRDDIVVTMRSVNV